MLRSVRLWCLSQQILGIWPKGIMICRSSGVHLWGFMCVCVYVWLSVLVPQWASVSLIQKVQLNKHWLNRWKPYTAFSNLSNWKKRLEAAGSWGWRAAGLETNNILWHNTGPQSWWALHWLNGSKVDLQSRSRRKLKNTFKRIYSSLVMDSNSFRLWDLTGTNVFRLFEWFD